MLHGVDMFVLHKSDMFLRNPGRCSVEFEINDGQADQIDTNDDQPTIYWVTIDVFMWVSPKSLGIPPNSQYHPANKSHKMVLKATS